MFQLVLKKMKNWNDTYTHKIDVDCTDCFVFSPHDICRHQISDHNYYAICQVMKIIFKDLIIYEINKILVKNNLF